MSLGTPLAEIVLFLGAYLIGGIPFGWLVGKLKGVDLRQVGSGSVGATNASRLWTGGMSIVMFVLVFALDFSKGLFVALFSAKGAEIVGHQLGSESQALTLQVICGLGAILGHVYTPYLKFKGGKGVATTFGVVTALAPLSSLFGLGAWGMFLALTRYMSMGSMAAVTAIPISYVLNKGQDTFNRYFVVFAFFTVIAGFVVWSHRSNIKRILQGSERRVGEADQKL